MILDIPPHIEQMIVATAQAQGISAEELALATLQSRFAPDEQAYYDWFYQHHYDRERLDKAMGETDENGCAIHTLTLPQGLNKAQLRAWLSENIPKHLENKTVKQGALA